MGAGRSAGSRLLTRQAGGRAGGSGQRAGTEGRDGTATSRPVPPELGTDRSASAEPLAVGVKNRKQADQLDVG